MGFQSSVNSAIGTITDTRIGKKVVEGAENINNLKGEITGIKTVTEGQTEQLKQIATLPERDEEKVNAMFEFGANARDNAAMLGSAAYMGDPKVGEQALAEALSLSGKEFNKLTDTEKN